jgi:hypothetical protein
MISESSLIETLPGPRRWHTARRYLVRMLAIAALSQLPHAACRAESYGDAAMRDECVELQRRNLQVISAELKMGQGTGVTCVVHGRIISTPSSTIHFRVDLPQRSLWNSKLLTIGGGGFDGFIPTEPAAPEAEIMVWLTNLLGHDAAQMQSFVRVSSDSGHQGHSADPEMDFSSWTPADNPSAVKNHAYAANHTVLWNAVDLATQYYGKPPKWRFMAGLSNGGRSSLAAVERYPSDYNGVLALEPAITQEAVAAAVGPNLFQWTFSSPDHWLNAAQTALYEKGELQACDGLDGLTDGILSDPVPCHYDGRNLLCPQGSSPGDSCLTAGQLETIRRIHAFKDLPAKLADDWTGYPGYGLGGESSDWEVTVFGTSFAARDSGMFVITDEIAKGLTGDPSASVMTLDPTKYLAQYRALADEIDSTDPDLAKFYRQGGKLIVWQGVSDAAVSYKQTARYIDSVEKRLGKQVTKKFLRFYVSPAMGHYLGGAGASTQPLLSALETWVEKGRTPGVLISTLSKDSAAPGSSRPLCEYPMYPRYRGKGDTTQALSFVCAQPEP